MRFIIYCAYMVLLSACVSRDAKQAKYVDDLVQSYDGLNIIGMALSPDGRYLAVDTVEEFSLGDRLIRKNRVFITLYDLQNNEAKILNPLGVLTSGVGIHSPSFDRSGRYMVMVTECFRPDLPICDEVRYGNQIISLDLKTGDVEQISSAKMIHTFWGMVGVMANPINHYQKQDVVTSKVKWFMQVLGAVFIILSAVPRKGRQFLTGSLIRLLKYEN